MSVRKIFRFWAGPKRLPERYQQFGEQWAALNPAWEVHTLGESYVRPMIQQSGVKGLEAVLDDLYQRDAGRQGIELWVQIADLMGYVIVHRFAGVYVNCDMQPVQPIQDFLPDSPWASYENNEDGRIVNAAIGAPERFDPFWKELLEGLPDRYFANPTDEMVMTTGPGYLTDFAHAHPGQLHVFPTDTFNPVHWKQIAPGGDASAVADGTDWNGTNTIAVHHWGHKLDGRSNVIETATQ